MKVIDIYQQPVLAEGEQIIAAPTLVKKLPLPLRRFIGDMSNTERILVGMDLRTAGEKKTRPREDSSAMMKTPPTDAAILLLENVELRARLEEAEDTLRAIRAGEVDALVIGEQVYSLKGAETPYRILIEAMKEGAATILADGTILYCNSHLAEMVKEPLQHVIGSSLRRFVVPDDLLAFDSLLAACRQAPGSREVYLRCSDGSSVPVQLSLSGLEVGDARGVCVVATDLTDRKRAEAALQKVRDMLEQRVAERTEELQRQREWLRVTLSSIGDAVVATDAEGRVNLLNPVAEALTGWSEADAWGRQITDVFRAIDGATHEPTENIMARVLRENRVLAAADPSAIVTRDGRDISIEYSAAPITDHPGHVSGVVLVFHDVTAKRRAQDELKSSNQELTRFNRAMVGRELRMIELKKEINQLCLAAGEPPRYEIAPPAETP